MLLEESSKNSKSTLHVAALPRLEYLVCVARQFTLRPLLPRGLFARSRATAPPGLAVADETCVPAHSHSSAAMSPCVVVRGLPLAFILEESLSGWNLLLAERGGGGDGGGLGRRHSFEGAVGVLLSSLHAARQAKNGHRRNHQQHQGGAHLFVLSCAAGLFFFVGAWVLKLDGMWRCSCSRGEGGGGRKRKRQRRAVPSLFYARVIRRGEVGARRPRRLPQHKRKKKTHKQTWRAPSCLPAVTHNMRKQAGRAAGSGATAEKRKSKIRKGGVTVAKLSYHHLCTAV